MRPRRWPRCAAARARLVRKPLIAGQGTLKPTEDLLVARLAEICASAAPQRLIVGIGDDAAVWRPSRSNLSVITTDALVEGVHFGPGLMSPHEIGHRSLAANLSDIAAMGARPVLATIALGLTERANAEWVEELYTGMAALARRTRCALAGGDLTRAPAITIVITVVGEVRPSNLKRRSGARPGDIIALSAPLGASHAGLRIARDFPHLAAERRFAAALRAFRTPEPQLAQGRWLGASANVHALMDSSDGLSTDLGRLCTASDVGALLDEVPVDEAAREVALLAEDDPLSYALDGGEDFALIAAIGARAFTYLSARFAGRFGRPLIAAGTFTAERGVRDAGGVPVASGGWDHLAARAQK